MLRFELLLVLGIEVLLGVELLDEFDVLLGMGSFMGSFMDSFMGSEIGVEEVVIFVIL